MMKRKDHKTLYINGIKFIALGYMHILILIATVFILEFYHIILLVLSFLCKTRSIKFFPLCPK